MLNDFCPHYSSDLSRVFNTQCPPWMTLRNAQHFLRFAVGSYGWPMVCAITPCRGCFGLIKKATCCACMRYGVELKATWNWINSFSLRRIKSNDIVDDNCCHCNVAGTRFAARVHIDDVIYASYKNQVYEVSAVMIRNCASFLYSSLLSESLKTFKPWNFEFSSGVSRMVSSILFFWFFLFLLGKRFDNSPNLLSRFSRSISLSAPSLSSVGNGGLLFSLSNSSRLS